MTTLKSLRRVFAAAACVLPLAGCTTPRFEEREVAHPEGSYIRRVMDEFRTEVKAGDPKITFLGPDETIQGPPEFLETFRQGYPQAIKLSEEYCEIAESYRLSVDKTPGFGDLLVLFSVLGRGDLAARFVLGHEVEHCLDKKSPVVWDIDSGEGGPQTDWLREETLADVARAAKMVADDGVDVLTPLILWRVKGMEEDEDSSHVTVFALDALRTRIFEDIGLESFRQYTPDVRRALVQEIVKEHAVSGEEAIALTILAVRKNLPEGASLSGDAMRKLAELQAEKPEVFDRVAAFDSVVGRAKANFMALYNQSIHEAEKPDVTPARPPQPES